MSKPNVLGVAALLIATACGQSTQATTPSPAMALSGGTTASSSVAAAPVSVGVGGAAAAPAAASGSGAAATASAGSTGSAGTPGGGPAIAASTGNAAGSSGAGGGPASAGQGGAPPSHAGNAAIGGAGRNAQSAAVSMPNIGVGGLGSGGIGVNDLDKATEFFTKLVGMTAQAGTIEREDRFERILTMGDVADRSTVTLMQFKDGRPIKDVPSKLVFYVDDPSAAAAKIVAGGYMAVADLGFASQAFGIDGYVLEFLQQTPAPMFTALAFAVSDLEKTTKFYSDAFNCKSTGDLDDPSGLQEHFIQVMDNGGVGAALVLQHYTQGTHNYKDNPCKTVWHVKDAAAQLDKVVMLGATMVSPAKPVPAFNNKLTSVAKDFDGYVIEMVQDE